MRTNSSETSRDVKKAEAARALIIFIRNPVLGRVKTRLAADAGKEQALEIYTALLRHTRETAIETACSRYLFYTDFIDDHDEWPEHLFRKRLQHGSNLGEKMLHAFETVLERHAAAVIIGSDCYALRTTHIESAFERLHAHEVVIGPAEDGGYYLLGLKKPHPFIFDGINWSTEMVLQQTLNQTEQNGLRYVCLEMLPDVDTLNDWERIKT